MNFYKHHIGDYDADTAHLSWLEDAAYRRLISLYCRREEPIPADMAQAYRLVRAVSKPERDAVAAVLAEFFTLAGDGWHNKRCDAEIAEAAAFEPEREAKKANNRERQQRNRDRRKALFDALRSHDIVPAFDASTAELQRLLSHAESRPKKRDVTRDLTHPVTRDKTAIQTPDTRHQTPEEDARASSAGEIEDDEPPTPSLAGRACFAIRGAGLQAVNPSDPRLQALLDGGTTVETLAGIAAEAAAKGKGWAWLLTVASNRNAEAAQMAAAPKAPPPDPMAWSRTRTGVIARADALQLPLDPPTSGTPEWTRYLRTVIAADERARQDAAA